MYYVNPEVLKCSFQGQQLNIMKQLLRLGWKVMRVGEFNGHTFVTTLQNEVCWAKFSFERPWPFAVFNGGSDHFLDLIERAGL